MEKSLNDFVEYHLQDLSTPEKFQFGIKCECCGTMLATKPVHFVKADITPKNDSQRIIYETMYHRDSALEKAVAVKVLTGHLNYCPVCKRIVCNHCFKMTGDLDMCADCAITLGVSGNTVSDFQDTHEIVRIVSSDDSAWE